MSKAPVRVAITGAAGQIGYQLSFRIASGQLLGPDQPVILQLLEIAPALDALKGVAMELTTAHSQHSPASLQPTRLMSHLKTSTTHCWLAPSHADQAWNVPTC